MVEWYRDTMLEDFDGVLEDCDWWLGWSRCFSVYGVFVGVFVFVFAFVGA